MTKINTNKAIMDPGDQDCFLFE